MRNGRIEFNNVGVVAWFVDDELHREDGPAFIWADGTVEWILHDIGYSFEEWCDRVGIDEKTRTFLRIKYGS